MNRNIVITSNLSAGGQDNPESTAIPAGKTWFVSTFGAADINFGDNKSSVFVLRFGTDIIKIISLTGSTSEIQINREFTGDGVKKFNIIRKNTSGTTKQLPCWLDMYERL